MESKTDRLSHEHSGALGGKVASSLRPGGEHEQRAVNMPHSVREEGYVSSCPQSIIDSKYLVD